MTQEREALRLALEALESDYTFEWPAMHRPERAEKKRFEAITALREALAQPAQEPDELTIAYMSGLYDGKKKRPWVGLTFAEMQDAHSSAAKNCPRGGDSVKWFAETIEAKLKEKNT